MAAQGMNIPTKDPGPIHTLESRDQQQHINEAVFSDLQVNYDNAARDVDALETALRAALLREQVLGAAMAKLNEPQQAPPISPRA